MKNEEALTVLTQVVEAYKGNAEEHRLLASALEVVSGLMKDKVNLET